MRSIGMDVHRSFAQVAIYDAAGGGMAAARAWWMLRALGHRAVSVVDGGWEGEGNFDADPRFARLAELSGERADTDIRTVRSALPPQVPVTGGAGQRVLEALGYTDPGNGK